MTSDEAQAEIARLRAKVARLEDEQRAAGDAWRIERWTHLDRVRTMGRAYGRLSAKYARLHRAVCWLPLHLRAPMKIQMIQGLAARLVALDDWVCGRWKEE